MIITPDFNGFDTFTKQSYEKKADGQCFCSPKNIKMMKIACFISLF